MEKVTACSSYVPLQGFLQDTASPKAGLDMTRDPQYYVGWENCNDMDQSKWWRREADRILKVVRQNKDNPRILWWIVTGQQKKGKVA